MAPLRVPFSRLIRFIAREDRLVYYGQPTTNGDIGLAFHSGEPVSAHVLTSSPLDPTTKVSTTVRTVLKLLSPLSRHDIQTIRGYGASYPQPGVKPVVPDIPIMFYKPLNTLSDPESDLILPVSTLGETNDYETEICIVIGKDAKDVTPEEAFDYVLGFSTVNDITCRSLAAKGGQVSFGKHYDTWTPFGPTIVTLDTLKAAGLDPNDLRLTTTLNGEYVQDSRTSQLLINLSTMISTASQGCTLEAGSLIMTGSPAVLGRPKDGGAWIRDGDEIRVFVEGLGTLINTVVEEEPAKAKL